MKYPFIKKEYQGKEPFLDQPSTILQSLSYPCHSVLCRPCHAQLAFTVLTPTANKTCLAWLYVRQPLASIDVSPNAAHDLKNGMSSLGKRPLTTRSCLTQGRPHLAKVNVAEASDHCLVLEIALCWSRGPHSPVVLAGCHFWRPQATTSTPALLLLPIGFVVQDGQKGRNAPAVINAGRVLQSNWILIM